MAIATDVGFDGDLMRCVAMRFDSYLSLGGEFPISGPGARRLAPHT